MNKFYITKDERIWIESIKGDIKEPNTAQKTTLNDQLITFGNSTEDWKVVYAWDSFPKYNHMIQFGGDEVIYSADRHCVLVIKKNTVAKTNNSSQIYSICTLKRYGDIKQNIIENIVKLDDIYLKSNKNNYYITDIILEYQFRLDKYLDKYVYDSDTSNETNTTDEIADYASVDVKQKAKNDAKKKINKKFVIGEHYYLRGKSLSGSKQDVKEFILKKYIYAINGTEVNALVVKQIGGINNAIFTLNRYDCKKMHIKYEPGLQVFSMMCNWIKKNENYN